MVGAEGVDRFFTLNGGDNTITGGADADQFWLAGAEFPESANTVVSQKLRKDSKNLILEKKFRQLIRRFD